MNKCFLMCLMMIGLCLKAQLSPYYQQHVEYKMNINVDADKFQYTGNQEIIYTNNSPDTLKVFYFHLYWNAFQPNSMMDQRLQYFGKEADRRMLDKKGISRISALQPNEIGYQDIQMLKQNGVPVSFKTEGTILEVVLAKPILPNSKTKFEMEWKAQVPLQIRRAGRNNIEGIDMTMTQWYPKVVEYDYEGWHTFDYIGREFHGVFGNFDVTIAIDKKYILGAGGVLQNPMEVKGYTTEAKPKVHRGKISWHFTAKNIHDFAWAADPDYTVENFQVSEGPLVYLVYQKSEKTKTWEESRPYIDKYFHTMKEYFGAYPYPAYSFIQGGDGGMEYGMCTMILGEASSVKDLCGLMFHEASHSWFQQVIATNESTRAWMDEGFTSYAENIAMGLLFPETVKNYPNPHFAIVNAYVKFAQTGQEEPMGILADHFKTNRAYPTAAYVKGEIFLVQLGYIVGEETLKRILKSYFNIWKFKHPTDRDFIHIAQKISGMDLKWYWNYMTATTRQIDYAIKEVKEANTATLITLENLGDFPMPVDVYIKQGGKTEVYTIPLNMMHKAKTTDFNYSLHILDAWKWTQKEYSFTLPVPKRQIENIMIDASQRLGDVDYKNNIYYKQK